MIIETKTGKHKSQVTKRELQEELQRRMKLLSEEERRIFLSVVDEMVTAGYEAEDIPCDVPGEITRMTDMYQKLSGLHYEREIVPVEEFVLSDDYLGHVGKDLYPQWLEDMKELNSKPYNEVIVTGATATGKCLDGETEVYDDARQKLVRLRDVAGSNVRLASFDQESESVIHADAIVCLSGYKRLGTLQLASGKELRLSADHPVMTANGWRPVGECKENDFIATARSLPSPQETVSISDAEVEFVAFMLADGSCSSGNWIFTKEDPIILKRFRDVTRELSEISTGEPVTVKRQNGLTNELYPKGTRWIQQKYGLTETSPNKRVPATFWGLPDRQLALFLNRIWACDDYVNARDFEITLSSKQLVVDLQQLLLRFGIHARVLEKQATWAHNGERKPSTVWSMGISGYQAKHDFIRKIGYLLGKEKVCHTMVNSISGLQERTNSDLVPVNPEGNNRIRGELSIPLAIWKKKYKFNGNRWMSRSKFVNIKAEYGLPEWCMWWGGVFWDRIVSFTEDSVQSPVYDVEVPSTGNFIAHGIVVHNTTFADIALAYDFYKLCMLRDPQRTFNLMDKTEIVLICFNRDEYLAREVTFDGFRVKVEQSPFFKKLGIQVKTSSILYGKKNLKVLAASSKSAKSLGRAVFGGIIDEADFLDGGLVLKDKAPAPGEKSIVELLHSNILRRMKGRFDSAGVMPGKLYLTSSAKSSDSFTNRRMGEASTDPLVFCRDYAQYEVKPADRFAKERFYVRVGNERLPHQILSRREYNSLGKAGRAQQEENGCRFIRVPMNFRADFERNIEDSIRDISGITTVSVMPFFQLRGRLYEMIDETLPAPVHVEEWRTDESLDIQWANITRMYRRKLGPGQYTEELRPIRHPDATRYVHLDLSFGRHDPAGLAIGHVVDYVMMERRGKDGNPFHEEVPIMEMDLMLRIVAPPGGEIDFGEIRGIVYDFQRHGYTIGMVSADGFQSGDSLQQFRKSGIQGEEVSVGKTMGPYINFKTAIYEGRISMYPYQPLITELEHLRFNEHARVKVDHPPGGKNDIADACCGVVHMLTTNYALPGVFELGITEPVRKEPDGDTAWVHGGVSKVEDERPEVGNHEPLFFLG